MPNILIYSYLAVIYIIDYKFEFKNKIAVCF